MRVRGSAAFWAAEFVAALLVAGCSDAGPNGGASPPLCTEACVVTDEGRRVEAIIGPDGGALTATTSVGATVTLTIPRGALGSPETISLVPLDRVRDVISSGGPTVAVLMEPDGLDFELPVNAALEYAAWPSEVVVGLARHDGTRITRWPATRAGDVLTVPLFHFSGLVAGDIEMFDAPETPEASAMAELGASLSEGDVAGIEAGLRDWYEREVRPALVRGAGSLTDAPEALREYVAFLQALQLGLGPGGLSDVETEAYELAGNVVRNAIEDRNLACLERHDHRLGLEALAWQAEGQLRGLDGQAGLDRPSVIDNLCFSIDASIDMPETIDAGESVDIGVEVAVRYQDGMVDTEPDIDVALTTGGTGIVSPDEGLAQQGRFEATGELADDADQLRVRATASLVGQADVFERATAIADGGWDLFLGVGDDIEDAELSASVGPGETAPLVVRLNRGTAAATGQTVSVSVDGPGSVADATVTIDEVGLASTAFTAGDEEGSAVVTARFVGDDANLVRTVDIDVGSPLVLQTEVADTIDDGAIMPIRIRAGVSEAGEVRYEAGLQLSLSATGGFVIPATGETDADGRFESEFGLGVDSDEIAITVQVTDADGSTRERTVMVPRTVKGCVLEEDDHCCPDETAAGLIDCCWLTRSGSEVCGCTSSCPP